jgi:hypothetical protein
MKSVVRTPDGGIVSSNAGTLKVDRGRFAL